MRFGAIPWVFMIMAIVAIRIRFPKPAIKPISIQFVVTLELGHVLVQVVLMIILFGLIAVVRRAV